ncbi:MAG: acetyl-CoA carboxylase biotin carboxyl carrier protein, partial [Elioraea sp.]|nr:acetyl-CoA carboxylase biotin carboxyl carrier protein [Elioraea sp.]
MDLRKLKKLIELVQESGIAELEITEGEEKVRISRGTALAPGTAVPSQATAAAAGAPPAQAAPAQPQAPVQAEAP